MEKIRETMHLTFDNEAQQKAFHRELSLPRGGLIDLAKNIAGIDDHWLTTPDLNQIRAAIREWRDQARACLDVERPRMSNKG